MSRSFRTDRPDDVRGRLGRPPAPPAVRALAHLARSASSPRAEPPAAGNVATRAWSSPAGQHPDQRIDTQRRAHLLQRAGGLQARARERPPGPGRRPRRLAAAMCPRSASRPSLTSHIAVAPGLGRARTGRVGRGGPAVRGDHRDRAAEPAAQHGEPAGRPARGARPARRRPRGGRRTAAPAPGPARSPSAVTDSTTASLSAAEATRSPPTTAAPSGAHSAASPAATPSSHAVWVFAGQASPTSSAVATPAHRGDVGQVGGRRLVPDVLGRRPVAPEVPALDEDVGGRHHPPSGVRRTAASSPGPPRRPARCRPGRARGRSRRTPRPPARCRPDRRAGRAGGGESSAPLRCWGRFPN